MSLKSATNFPSLTKVLHLAFLSAPSGLDTETMAGLVGKPYQTLMSELSGQSGHKLGADFVLPLCRVTGSDEPLLFIARQMGGVFLRLPDPGCHTAALSEGLGQSIKEFGEFITSMSQALLDGHVSRAEYDQVTRESQEAVEAILSLMKLVRHVYETQNGE